MAVLPPSRSPWWLVVVLVTAALWTAALLGVRASRGVALDPAATITAVKVAAVGSGALALFGALGARRTFVGAHVGLVIGYGLLLGSLSNDSTGWGDLAGVAEFLMLGAIGLAVGVIADIVAQVRRRSS